MNVRWWAKWHCFDRFYIQEILDERERKMIMRKPKHELQNCKTRSIEMRCIRCLLKIRRGFKFLINKLQQQQHTDNDAGVPSIRTNGFSRCPNHFINATVSLDPCCALSFSLFLFFLCVRKFNCSIYYKYLAQWIPLHFSTAYFHSPLLYTHTHKHTLALAFVTRFRYLARMFSILYIHFYVTIHKFSHAHLHKLVIETNTNAHRKTLNYFSNQTILSWEKKI